LGKAKFTHTRRAPGCATANTGWPCTAMRPASVQVTLSSTSTSWRPMAGRKM